MKKNPQIVLIVTNKEDEHADYIIDRFNKSGIGERVIRINTEDFLSNIKASFNGTCFKCHIIDSDRSFTNNDIISVWYRRPLKINGEHIEVDGERSFAISQGEAFLSGLYACTHSTALWVNPIPANLFAKNKLYQLFEAKKVGLCIPNVIVTNNSYDAMNFGDKNPVMCTKSLTIPRFAVNGKQYPFYTRKVVLDELKTHSSNIAICPTMLEEYIEKQCDLRVVIFGEKIFAFEIASQSNELSMVDVRGVNPELLAHTPIDLPDNLKHKIILYLRNQGIYFSSMDFVRRKDGEYIFIENNCNGQWLWLEYITHVDMSGYFIGELLQGKMTG